MIAKDKRRVGGLDLVGLSGQRETWTQEWRRMGVVDVDGHQHWQSDEERAGGYVIARKQLDGYEENGIWFYR